ncbi:single-stranded DNA-binding protein [uncultured phage_Deep1-GF2-KM23-C739]|uniref:Single-stranded DNA-binding protein n=1 Tax=uncultured phage_Deep1-GF2-KM23-C739 TaxID=2740798 RepID=A0A1B1IVZ3_9CAUD|nr:single-stranded DNA-binding protein [uncultured phage_Deep1-GF2-KM23-C739]ANS05486.1 single-stranded DNA-binding protein [uncultured phage_Deep1-GF2-KM23-C739]
MEKPKTYTSPFGKAIYPHLSKADVRFKPEGEFHVDLEVNGDKALELVTLVDKFVEKALTEEKKKGKRKNLKKVTLPYKKENDKFIFKFKMKAKGTNSRTGEAFTQRPAIFDNELKPLNKDIIVWGGSTLRVSFFPREWYTPLLGAGVSLRLKSVQVKNLVEGSSMNGSSQGFEKVDGDSSTKNESDEAEILQENNSSADF